MEPGTVLLITFAALVAGLFALFWLLAGFLQPFLYSEAAAKLPLRCLAAAVGVAAFLTFWTYLNTRSDAKDKYGTFFEFNPTQTTDVLKFDAVRRYGPAGGDKAPEEKSVPYKRTGGRGSNFVEEADPAKPFALTTADYVVVAVDIKDGDAAGRYEADLDAKGKFKPGAKTFRGTNRRYLEFGQSNIPSPVYSPNRGAYFGALLLNAGAFLIWAAAAWLGLRFTLGHSMGFAAAFGGLTIVILMPLLFEKNKVKPAAAEPKPAVAAGG